MNAPFDRHRDVIDAVRLEADLTALAEGGDLSSESRRRAVLDLLRETREAARDKVRKRLELGLKGRDAAQLLGHIEDALLRALYDSVTTHVFPADDADRAERLSMVAVGGYGRGDLAPYSDIDLLFLQPYRPTAWGEKVIEFVLYMLWDLGLKVGHATRTVRQCVQLARDDMTIRTALLEMRHVCGDAALFDDLKKAFRRDVVPGTNRAFIEAKLTERDRRHVRAGGSRYVVEPNVKEGKGGLRDLHTLFWIAKYVYRVEDGRELVDAGLFTDAEYQKILKSYSFLWSVRCELHFLAGRAEERLSFDVQPEMARRLGYRDRPGQSAVERFMKHYFRVAKDVGDLTRIFCAALEVRHEMRWPPLGGLLRMGGRLWNLPPGFVVDVGRLDVTGQNVFSDDPVNLFRLFHLADQKSYDIHPNALKLVKRSLKLIDDGLRADTEANRLFLEVLTSKRDPERALRRMSEAGVLGKFIPEFGRIEAMMQFNMYHHYTVDEHLIRAIGWLARIERGELADEHPVSHEIIHKILSREVLYVALFLHDIAKGRPEDHSAAGRDLAHALCPRLGLTGAETETVAWLVEHHLVMSEFAQSRDTTDPRTIEAFTNLVQSPERLRLLLVLTVADIRAVGPGVWNGWKGQLLRDLYYEAENVLQGGAAPGSATYREARIQAAKDALDKRIADWRTRERDTAISRHGDDYWLSFDVGAHLKYATLMRNADRAGEDVAILCDVDPFKAITEVAVYTQNKHGLFAQLAGAFAVSGASIRDAKIFTTIDDKALDIFLVQDTQGQPFDDKMRLDRLAHCIRQTIRGEIVLAERLGGLRVESRVKAFTIEPQVWINNQASLFHTVIEVDGRDRPGLLHDLARAISQRRLTIASAHIATYGAHAVDVFYVKDRAGLKLTNSAAIEALRRALVDVLATETAGDRAKAAE